MVLLQAEHFNLKLPLVSLDISVLNTINGVSTDITTNITKHFAELVLSLDIWNQSKYQFSDPDAWLYDVNNINGWGDHPDY